MDDRCKTNMLLMFAIDRKNHKEMENLLQSGADPNTPNPFATNGNSTPLHVAIAMDDPVAAEILLRWGAKCDTKNSEGRSPLDAVRSAEMEALIRRHWGDKSLCRVEHLEGSHFSYFRRQGTSSIAGQMYEYKLLALVLLRLKKGRYQFLLGTNVDGIGDFDDLCVRYRRAGESRFKYVFVQAKHREDPEKKKISYERLKEVNFKKSFEYGVHKHFENYLKIREKFRVESEDEFFAGNFEDLDVDFALYTNASSEYETNNQINCDALLKTSKDGKVLMLEVNDEMIESLCKNVNESIVGKIRTFEEKSNETNFKQVLAIDFLKKFKIYYSQARETQVGEIIGEELDSKVENRQLLNLIYHDLVQKYWMGKGEAVYLSESCEFLKEAEKIVADRHLLSHLTRIFHSRVVDLKLQFLDKGITELILDQFMSDRDKTLINIHSEAPQISLAKISQYFMQKFCDTLAVIDIDQIDDFVKIFSEFSNSSNFACMIIYCTTNGQKLQEYLSTSVEQLCKKIILISDKPFQGCDNQRDNKICLNDLALECQERILNSKSIMFQNKEVKMLDIMGSLEEVDHVSRKWISGEILLKLLKDSVFEVAPLSTKQIDYFIHRKFCPYDELTNIRIYKMQLVENVDSFKERVVIIAAEPGMGKSTILTALSRHYPSSWIVRFNLLDFTQQLCKMKKSKIDLSVAIQFILHTLGLPETSVELQGNKIRLNLLSQANFCELKLLELKVFQRYFNQNKIMVFADGFDEIAPTYMEPVLQIFNLIKESNVRRLLVTTRATNVKNFLEKQLSVRAYSLVPFKLVDIQEFCRRYWKCSLNIPKLDDGRVHRFTTFLVHRYRMISEDVHDFISVPLHTEMIARCVQDTFEKYHKTGEENYINQLKSTLEGISLYREFIRTKFEDIYLIKNKIDPTSPINRDFLEDFFYDLHKRLALCALFDHEMIEFLAPGALAKLPEDLAIVDTRAERWGFVYRVVDGRPQFVHLTFAEFFVADVIWETFKRISKEQFSLFVERVLIEYLIENDMRQLSRFLQDFAMHDSTGVIVDFAAKGCLLLDKMHFELNKSPTDIFVSLVERCTIDDCSDIMKLIDALLLKQRWALLKLSITEGCPNLLRALSGMISQGFMRKVSTNSFDLLLNMNEGNNLECAQILVNEFGYDVNWADNGRPTYLLRLLKNSAFGSIKALLNCGITELANPDINVELPIYYALSTNDSPQDVIEAFVSATNLVQFQQNFLPKISWYLLKYDLSLAEMFLAKGVDMMQAFLFERNEDFDYSEYISYLQTPRWINQMQLFLENGVGFHGKLLQFVKNVHVILGKAVDREIIDESFKLIPLLEILNSKYYELIKAINTRQLNNVRNILISIPSKVHRKTILNGRDEVFGSPLLYAATINETKMAEFLLAQGANPNIILYYERNQCCDKFAEHFHRVMDFRNITPLHIAACEGNLELLKLLLSKGANIHLQTPITPLHLAAREGHREIVQHLLEQGARSDVKTFKFDNFNNYFEAREEYTPLELAQLYRHVEIVELLKSYQPTLLNGFTKLHRAAAGNDLDEARILIQSGHVDVNATTRYSGYTPLHVGAENGHAAIVLLLLRNKADKNALSFKGKTARDVALEKGFGKIAKMIDSFNLADLQMHQSYTADFIKIKREAELYVQCNLKAQSTHFENW